MSRKIPRTQQVMATKFSIFDLRIPTFTSAQAQFAVTADGQKFLIVNTFGENKSEPITVALNWTADLKK